MSAPSADTVPLPQTDTDSPSATCQHHLLIQYLCPRLILTPHQPHISTTCWYSTSVPPVTPTVLTHPAAIHHPFRCIANSSRLAHIYKRRLLEVCFLTSMYFVLLTSGRWKYVKTPLISEVYRSCIACSSGIYEWWQQELYEWLSCCVAGSVLTLQDAPCDSLSVL